MGTIVEFLKQTGFALIAADWKSLVMIDRLYPRQPSAGSLSRCSLPIAMGMLLTNLPGAGIHHAEFFKEERWIGALPWAGLLDYLYLGVKLGIYPCLIFVGVAR